MQTPSEVPSNYSLHIEAWQESGKSIRQFCKDENLGYHSFHYWKKKLQKRSDSGFVKLKRTASKPGGSGSCEVISANGLRIVFHELPPADFVKQLLK